MTITAVEVMGSFQETAPRKTTKNTVKHHDGGVGSVVASHRGGGESLVVVTTLLFCTKIIYDVFVTQWRTVAQSQQTIAFQRFLFCQLCGVVTPTNAVYCHH